MGFMARFKGTCGKSQALSMEGRAMIFTIEYNYNNKKWLCENSDGGWYREYLKYDLLDRVVYVGY